MNEMANWELVERVSGGVLEVFQLFSVSYQSVRVLVSVWHMYMSFLLLPAGFL